MVTRVMFIVFLSLMSVVASFGQKQEPDSQTLHEILVELRAIHNDMRVTETTQLLVAELEMQQGVVNRATENADSARSKLNDVHADQKHIEAELEIAQEHLAKVSDEDRRNAFSEAVERHKSNLAELKNIERERSATLQQMEQRLQAAQDKLASIEDELSAAISQIAPTSKGAVQK